MTQQQPVVPQPATTQRVVIAGGSGFIGQYLAEAYRSDGWDVKMVGRSGPDARWGDTAAITGLLDGADLLVNLAGKSVNCRYTPANRAEIMRSRIETTRELADAIRACAAPPPLWVNSSTATIYRHSEDRPMTETDGEIGTGFSVGIATAWEKELFSGELPGTRRVALRMAIVLGDGSALIPLIRLTQFGLGGPQLDGRWPSTRARREAGTFHERRAGDGGQRFSWIHIEDVLGIIRYLVEHDEIDGVINAAAPEPEDNKRMMAALRRAVGAPIGIPTPRWMLETGSALIRTETELVLKSRWVIPERIVSSGYTFSYPNLEPALTHIVHNRGLLKTRPNS